MFLFISAYTVEQQQVTWYASSSSSMPASSLPAASSSVTQGNPNCKTRLNAESQLQWD